jgi:hypothetical protein
MLKADRLQHRAPMSDFMFRNENRMTENNSVMIVAVLAVVASLAAAGFSYYSMSSGPRVSGFASTDTGTTSLTITSTADINFTDDTISFGAGRVNPTYAGATLDTDAGTVVNGTWTPETTGFVLENVGNVNVSLTLQSAKNAAELLGGTAPAYQMKVTDVESGSCLTNGLSSYTAVDKSKQAACGKFLFATGTNTLNVDVRLYVPYDSTTGALSDIITAEATAA